ncbi:aminopeptidase PepB [[Haemophilus] felis]|uniref:Aminopeptidase PepB n=1 Tax=[Haemophilus] felis TaxID=123822 RepID=A0A1T0BC53_9PAST|nr:aminopeptidase PepB [[Haemophilus] felis]OOS07654.1 aminopeptidase PepB [[Haemophilus] felis]
MSMQVLLSTQAASSVWGKNALLSFNQEQATVHLKSINDGGAIQRAARKLRAQGINQVSLIGEDWNLDNCWHFYQGFYSAKLDFQIHFPEQDAQTEKCLSDRIACANFAREIINLPADVITPVVLAERCAAFIRHQAEKQSKGNAVQSNIISGEALKQQGYVGIWNVGKGSTNLAAMLQLDFNPSGEESAPVLACLVGKGITFDSGGYSIKPSDGMSTMRTDMGGAALVSASLALAIANGLNKRVKLYLCCAENMVNSRAFKLGDIIHYPNGVSVEVLNTDAEGRLVLADGLIEADKQQPQFIIDCATLTGAAKVAVGNDYHSVLSIDDDLVTKLMAAAKVAKEPFWRLPFEDLHRAQIQSAFADIANIGSVPVGAGASTATAFLSYFVKNYQTNWLHIDCSATYRKSASDLWATGATGIGVQTLATLLLQKSTKEN